MIHVGEEWCSQLALSDKVLQTENIANCHRVIVIGDVDLTESYLLNVAKHTQGL